MAGSPHDENGSYLTHFLPTHRAVSLSNKLNKLEDYLKHSSSYWIRRMWTGEDETTTTMEKDYSKSGIACHSCRRRKIRCGRELPHCVVCQQVSQVCEYPAKPLKPGPKIGSTHQNRKRRRRDENSTQGTSIVVNTGAPHTRDEDAQRGTSSRDASASQEDEVPDAQDVEERPASFRRRESPSAEAFEDRNGRGNESINIQDLSFILHPAHEPSMSEKNTSPNSMSEGFERDKSTIFTSASRALGVAPGVLEEMVKMYFNNMTAINIFHEPSFEGKILSGRSSDQTHALLASMLAFSARFCTADANGGQNHNISKLAGMNHTSEYFLNLASRLVDEALRDCDDEEPQLCIIQAQILIAHGHLTQGVRGKAWRSLGTCVRLAYELNLHLVDAGPLPQVVDTRQSVEAEEKRRAWWAIWEMDVFASTVRRYPTAVNWSQIETLLPIEDEYWFRGESRTSCFLERDPILRWKILQESGNRSAKAWYIVINSLMKDAQSISSPRSVPGLDLPAERRPSTKSGRDKHDEEKAAEEARDMLETLSNCVRCFVMALPPSLKYRNEYLSFDERQPGEIASLRQDHCGIYNIYIMTQLAKLMIHHYDVFAVSSRSFRPPQDRSSRPSDKRHCENLSRQQYFEAADEISRIVSRSSDDHIQHINAFLASTIWLASAVQLVRRKFGPVGTNQSLVQSRFEVLNMIYKKCVSFWGIRNAMQQNLDTLESQLETFRGRSGLKPDRSQQVTDNRPQTRDDLMKNGSSIQVAAQSTYSKSQSTDETTRHYQQQVQGLQNHPNKSRLHDTIPNHSAANNLLALHSSIPSQPSGLQYQSQTQVQPPLEPISPALSSLDFMHIPPRMEKNQQPSQHDYMDGTSPSGIQDHNLFSGAAGDQFDLNTDGMHGESFGMYEDGWNSELPSYIHNLLSGP